MEGEEVGSQGRLGLIGPGGLRRLGLYRAGPAGGALVEEVRAGTCSSCTRHDGRDAGHQVQSDELGLKCSVTRFT